jgi:predicted Rossmann fold flavoprotein
MQGLALRDIELSVWNPKGKLIKAHKGDMLFTHFGISGPAVLRCSQYVVKALKKFGTGTIEMRIDTHPEWNEEKLFQHVSSLLAEEPKKAVKNIVKNLVPERYLLFLLQRAEIDPSTAADQLSKNTIRNFVQLLKSFSFSVNGTLSIEKAFVTGGGISIKEVDPKSMASKMMQGLYFCGEVLDLHGYTGGYNITVAFVTGHLAGTNAAQQASYQ